MNEARLQIRTLAQLGGGARWQFELAHDRPYHTLMWFTRGQGRMLLDGRLRGIGPHNAVFVPAATLFAVEVGAQSLAQVVTIPDGTPLRLPEQPHHLRIRDKHIQTELSALIESAQREQSLARPLAQDALEAHVALISVWLRRQMALDEHVPDRRSAGERLSRRFMQMVSTQYASGLPTGFYAKELGVTPTHLARVVKTATGKTASDVLTERVVHAARSLLEGTNHPARNIAQHLGFGSAAYFTRFVQQHTGHSPSQLRAASSAETPKTKAVTRQAAQ